MTLLKNKQNSWMSGLIFAETDLNAFFSLHNSKPNIEQLKDKIIAISDSYGDKINEYSKGVIAYYDEYLKLTPYDELRIKSLLMIDNR
jgi:hypothetical protein